MPTVPIGPRVESAPLQGGFQSGNVQEAAFTGNARELVRAGAGLQDFGASMQRIQDREDLDTAMRVETTIKSDFLQYDADQRRARRGAAAKGLVTDTEKWFDEAAARYGKDLSPGARNLVGKSLQAARLQGTAAALRYEEQERDRSLAEAYTANQAVEVQRVAQTGDVNAVPASLELMRKRVAEQGALRGWTPEQVQAEGLRWASTLHQQMVAQLMNSDPTRAKQYLDANRTEIDSARLPQLDAVVGDAAQDRQAQQQADAIAALPFDQQLAAVSKIEDPKLREKVRLHAEQNQAAIARAQAAREKQASDTIWQQVANGASLSSLPRSVLAQMDGRDRLAVTEHYRAEARRAKLEAEGKAVKTDLRLLDDIYSMPPADFLKLRISSYQDRLSRGDVEQLILRQAKLREPAKAVEVVSMEQQVNNTLSQLKLKSGDPKAGAFRKAAYDDFAAFAKATGKEADYDQRQKIIDRLTIERDQWLGTTRYFEVLNDPARRAAFTPEIPDADRQQITAALRAKGRPATEENIVALYKRAKGL